MIHPLLVGAVLVMGLFAGGGVLAQGYPTRPIRLVLPFPPGGAPDTMARVLAEQLRTRLGQSVVIDNRAGANGIVGYDIVAKSAPDGYTLVYATGSFAGNVSAYRKLPYDALKDFAPITQLTAGAGYVILVHPAVPATSVRELIPLARNTDKPLAYASPGVGNTLHLATELFNLRAGTHLLHVPYKGTAAGFNALFGGEIQVLFVPPVSAIPYMKTGKVRALAITGAARWEGMPDLPTVSETGIPGFVANFTWNGCLAPARTPERIVTALNAAIRDALESPKMRDYLAANGYVRVGSTPAGFREFVAQQIRLLGEIMREAKVAPQ